MSNLKKETQQKAAVIFMHIPKAGGTTLSKILKKQYKIEKTFSIDGAKFDESVDEFKRLPELKRKELVLLQGHMLFGLHNFLPQHSTYITILRDPVERIISHYHYVQQNPDHYLYETVVGRNMNLEDYACSQLSSELENCQTKFISGINYSARTSQEANQLLEQAKQNLKSNFLIAGLLEEFDKTLLLLQELLNWNTPFYITQNETRNRPSKTDISMSTLKVIQEFNQLDIDLYQYVKKNFNDLTNQKGLSLEKRLKQFRYWNRFYKNRQIRFLLDFIQPIYKA